MIHNLCYDLHRPDTTPINVLGLISQCLATILARFTLFGYLLLFLASFLCLVGLNTYIQKDSETNPCSNPINPQQSAN